ncbi:DegV family protein [Ruminococcaceae bacterium OttesenSCG-928-A16]|nr:DegV family protein [Ruminococcaceae bacterium OttesenSCG-928-A16]
MPKRKIAVLTDSACDLPVDLAEKSGVDIMNFEITVDGESYTERQDFTFDEYYEMLRTCEKVPATAHVTMPRFLAQFEAYDDEGLEQVLYVSINASGSATNDAAVMAEREFRQQRPGSRLKITIVDSRTYSVSYGWYVTEAARKLNNGAEMGDVVEWLKDKFSRVEIALAAYSLRFMKKSGRISAAAAFAGELLGLRPIISLIDGKSVVRKKVRGDKEVLPALMEQAANNMDDTKEYMIGGTSQPIIDELAALCKKKWKAEPLITFKLGAAVASNTGPDAIAIVYIGEKREDV